MHSSVLKTWGKVGVQPVGAAVQNRATYPQLGLFRSLVVHKWAGFYSARLGFLPATFHKVVSLFVSVRVVIIPTTHTTNKNEHKLNKFTFYLIGA
jgi:hypothetical protein